MNPTVSINICCYNSEKYLEETLQSVFAQTYKDWELVIVNDGSTDSTEEIIHRHMADGLPIIYQYQSNAGLGNARNKALSSSRGNYIAFLDHDDLWVPEKLAVQVELMDRQPDVAVCYADAGTIDENGKTIRERLLGFRRAEGNMFVDLLTKGDFINWQTVVIRRQVLEDLGAFKPYKIVEDYDVLLRCAVSHKFVCIDRVLAKYRLHDSNSSSQTTEHLSELAQIKEYWLANLPPEHIGLKIALQCEIPEYHFKIGKRLCLEGNTLAGRVHLRRAWPDCTHRWRAMLMALLAYVLAPQTFLSLIKLKHSLQRRIDYAG